jgi:hypothetical protein
MIPAEPKCWLIPEFIPFEKTCDWKSGVIVPGFIPENAVEHMEAEYDQV